MSFFLIVLNQVIIPSIFVVFFHKREIESKSNFIFQFIFTCVFVSAPLVIGAQSWTSIYLGYFIFGFFLFATVKKLTKLPKKWGFQFGSSWKQISFFIVQCFLLIIFLPLLIWGFSGYSPDNNQEVIDLHFPMKEGLFIVGHGGSNPLINYHNASETQAYAIDISGLNLIGTRAWGVYPSELDRYDIFGENLYSPCDGVVKRVIKDQKDFNPPETGEGHPAGNHVEMDCNGATVILAHMKENTVVVDSAQVLKSGELLGQIGNSGNTSEPHLHIHAEKDGKGIPIEFNGRFLVRNSIVWE